MSPILFNLVVYASIHHWVTVVAATEEGTGGLGMPIRDLAVYFYSGNGLVASTQPERLHRAFNILTGLFYWVGLKTNTRKMVIIAYQPFHAPVRMLVEAY